MTATKATKPYFGSWDKLLTTADKMGGFTEHYITNVLGEGSHLVRGFLEQHPHAVRRVRREIRSTLLGHPHPNQDVGKFWRWVSDTFGQNQRDVGEYVQFGAVLPTELIKVVGKNACATPALRRLLEVIEDVEAEITTT